jgi:GNAT superfamily N-acetyltransferase
MGKVAPHPALSPPEKLTKNHEVADFQCGEVSLDDWLRRRALQNEESGASRTYVVCTETRRVAGYYALAAGANAHAEAPGKVKRNMPDPVPVLVLGRLAVDKTHQGQGLGASLLRDAILRSVQAADIAGIKALLVHAISDSARQFYEAAGFVSSPVDPMTLMITITEAARIITAER